MISEQMTKDLKKAIEPLFKREKNTLYEVHLVYQVFSDQLNVFFEWGRIGHATTSRQIRSFSHSSLEQVQELQQVLSQLLPVTVRLN
ncbi:hypothetical protein [Fructobacillus papyrifericola]|uniref:WGR domain-containing protein n=1 Tax=Fructobacillus papyrifericola TaxID=2713172 RepID=A0ABS5QS72_9LACO|nr:hypothetical protein [Fructobacillus papyrifericola]MBS9335981.1 hypothetical protein [Fructobacillus papyrifericola]